MSFFEVHDPAFRAFVMGNAPVKRLATGFDWVEGPVWFGDMGCLLFSDIPSQSTIIGGVVIASATLWLARRESNKARQRNAAEVEAEAEANGSP